MQETLAKLIQFNELQEIDTNLYVGEALFSGGTRIYGGQVLAQALSAAQHSVAPEFGLHSLHSYFMRMGDPKHKVVYEVDPIRDGRSFVTRRVVAKQYGKAIFSAALSFQREDTGLEHSRPMPQVPPPESLVSDEQLYAEVMGESQYKWPIEFRQVQPQNFKNPQKLEAKSYSWFRAVDRLGDDLRTHQQLLAYASDNPILVTALRPHGIAHIGSSMQVITLDHALWFYEPFRIDEWLLYEVHSDIAGKGRALSRGRIYRQDGTMVAAVAQEGVLRWMK